MTRRARRKGSNALGGLFLLLAGSTALIGSLFGTGPPQQTKTDVPTIAQPVTPAPAPAPTAVSVETRKSSAEVAKPAWRNVWITGHKVPIRSEANATASIIDRVDNGLLVAEYERRDNWVLVEHPISGKRGWVSAKRISLSAPAESDAERKRDKEIKPPSTTILATAAIVALLIKESLAEYHSHAPCACPYDRDRRGHQCGARSAWSRPGGYAPLCYPKDITPEAIAAYRARHEASRQSR